MSKHTHFSFLNRDRRASAVAGRDVLGIKHRCQGFRTEQTDPRCAISMPPILQAASQSIRDLLRTPGVQSFDECRLRNDRQSYVALSRQLVQAQFVLRDWELTTRLWQDVASREMDLGRIINLLYCCASPEDDEAMRCIDEGYLALINRKDP